MKFIKAAIFATTLGAASLALACPGKHEGKTASANHSKAEKSKDKTSAEPAKVSVQDAAKLKEAGKIVMIDANGENTRKKEGVVPGARLLSHYKDFDMKELNVTKKDTLVFYCGSTKCSAAPKAATIAASKGYKAKVMDAGIRGWKEAGYPTAKI